MAGKAICIDAFNLGMPKGSGIATYARNLAGAIATLGYEAQLLYGPPQRPGSDNLLNEVALFDAPRNAPSPKRRRAWQRWLSPPEAPRATRVTATGEVIGGLGSAATGGVASAWSAFDVFHAANREHGRSGAITDLAFGAEGEKPIDLMHWTCPLPIRARGAANVYTIHDLVPLRAPYTTLDNKERFRALIDWICRQADHVLTVSETTRRDVIRMFGIDEGRVTNAFQAVDFPAGLAGREEAEVAAEVEAAFGLGWRGYFLFFGALEPKKNLARVIEAYLAAGVTTPLVIVGGAGWLEEGQLALLHEDLIASGQGRGEMDTPGKRIRRYDYLPLTTLVSLIRGAKATVFPSLYEGFGLPVLESMLLGTPVITSTAGALREVAGEAALLVDPLDVTAIKRAIQTMDSDEALRTDLAARGVQQSAKFDAAHYRERLAPVYGALI